jgi:hypothetical protein
VKRDENERSVKEKSPILVGLSLIFFALTRA